jgi:hypothetical protein
MKQASPKAKQVSRREEQRLRRLLDVRKIIEKEK